MTPKQVRSLLAVVQHGSVNKAAQHLYLAPSSVSAQLKELQQILGTDLFENKGRNIVLNQTGQNLLPYFQDFCAQETYIKALAREADTDKSGSISLFAPSSMCIYRVPEIIHKLQEHSPNIELLLVHEPFDYETALKQGELDAALIVTESQYIEQHIAPHYDYVTLYDEEVVFLTHPTLHQQYTLTPAELNAQALITTEPACSYRKKAERHFQQHGLKLAARQNFSNVEVIKRCLLNKMGTGLLPRCVVADELASGQLLEQQVEGLPYQFQSLIIYPKRQRQPAKIETFLNLLAEE